MSKSSHEAFPFFVSPVQEADIPAIMAIEQRSFSLPWTPGIYRYELQHNPYGLYRAIRSKHPSLPSIVAYAGVWLYVPEAHISTIAVHPAFRGLHMGAWILAAVLVEAAMKGAEEATLEVRVSNRPAQRLYLSFGFRMVGRRYGYYSDNREDAYIMTLRPLELPYLQRRLQQEKATVRERWLRRKADILAQFGAKERGAST